MGKSNHGKCNLHDNNKFARCEKVYNLNDLNDLPSTITQLKITNSDLPTLNFDSIPVQLSNLIVIVFDGCKIEYIKIETSTQFTTVRYLYIRHNNINIIRENTFQQFPNVVNIVFDNNKVKKIYKDAFNYLFDIEMVNLANNNIEEIEDESFNNLPKLKILDLSFNDKLQPFTYTGKSSPTIMVYPHKGIDINLPATNGWTTHLWYYIGISVVLILSCTICCCSVCTAAFVVLVKDTAKLFSKMYDMEIGQIKIEKRMADNVWKGTLQDGRSVAVKKYLKASSSKPDKELDILLHMSNTKPSPNIVQYFCKEENDNHLYIALELCDMNLEKAVRTKREATSSQLNTWLCLRQITDGLRHIHKQGIQHRDIKPANILLKQRDDGLYFLISDFDLGHFEKENSDHKKPYGTSGWAAPELWKGGKRTTAVDIFSLGCVFYYVLANGRHPFGPIDNLEQCQQTICQSTEQPKLTKLQELGQSFTTVLAKSLINSMLERDFRKRPKVMSVVEHPMFWNEEKISKFYHNIGKMSVDKEQETFQRMLRADSSEVYSTGDWTSYLDTIVKCDVDKRMDRADICKLLRFIRNKTEHFDELSEELKHTYYCCSEGVARYFNEKFPKLLLYTFQKKEELNQVNRKKRT